MTDFVFRVGELVSIWTECVVRDWGQEEGARLNALHDFASDTGTQMDFYQELPRPMKKIMENKKQFQLSDKG